VFIWTARLKIFSLLVLGQLRHGSVNNLRETLEEKKRMNLWKFGLMKIAIPISMIILSRKLYSSGGKLTQRHQFH
jgi:hypothetical protein